MSRKSNKTAHVLNLITSTKNHGDTSENSDAKSEDTTTNKIEETTTDDKKAISDIPSMEVPWSEHNPISLEIKNKLLEFIDEETNGYDNVISDSSKNDSKSKDNILEDSTPIELDNQSNLEYSDYTNEPQVLQDDENKDISESHVVESFSPVVFDKPTDSYEPDINSNSNCCYVNVLEIIVKEHAKEILEKMSVCTCDRCIADVTALTLNNLPAKYIVADKSNLFPLLNYYRNYYSTNVTSQLIKASITVGKFPHH